VPFGSFGKSVANSTRIALVTQVGVGEFGRDNLVANLNFAHCLRRSPGEKDWRVRVERQPWDWAARTGSDLVVGGAAAAGAGGVSGEVTGFLGGLPAKNLIAHGRMGALNDIRLVHVSCERRNTDASGDPMGYPYER
jgi:hypothetical protein